jgi:hypothetical protein
VGIEDAGVSPALPAMTPLSLVQHRAPRKSSRTLPDFQKVTQSRLVQAERRFCRSFLHFLSLSHDFGAAGVGFKSTTDIHA